MRLHTQERIRYNYHDGWHHGQILFLPGKLIELDRALHEQERLFKVRSRHYTWAPPLCNTTATHTSFTGAWRCRSDTAGAHSGNGGSHLDKKHLCTHISVCFCKFVGVQDWELEEDDVHSPRQLSPDSAAVNKMESAKATD